MVEGDMLREYDAVKKRFEFVRMFRFLKSGMPCVFLLALCFGVASSCSTAVDLSVAQSTVRLDSFETVVLEISESGKTIYDPFGADEQNLWLSNLNLEDALNNGICGMSVKGLPLRTRSKAVRQAVCKALGYPVEKSFKKSQPRFPGQNFDIYIQKSNNLQVWNESLVASRRYVLIRVLQDDIINKVKVVDGATLAKLDKTGKLTQKYQARFTPSAKTVDLASTLDSENVQALLGTNVPSVKFSGSPVDAPDSETFIPIDELARRLSVMIGDKFPDAGHDQERNRGAELQRRMCCMLGYGRYRDDGVCPDITAQLIEVKLQTSTTIDLGIFSPDSCDKLSLPAINGRYLRHCDVRYAIFYGDTDGTTVTLTHLVLVTGEDLFKRFKRFGGKVLNKKLQIYLPDKFFGDDDEHIEKNRQNVEMSLH